VLMVGVLTVAVEACGDDRATAPEPPPASVGAFTLSATPTTVRVLQGASGASTITIERIGGFAQTVSLTVTGAPPGLTATITPSATTGTTATLLVTTVAVVDAETVTLTITGRASGRADQMTTATVAITPRTVGEGNVRLDFTTCPELTRPVWVASQDGDGAWTQLLGPAEVYRFNVAAAKGGYAYVSQGFETTLTTVFATQAELTSATIFPCESAGRKRLSGTVVGLGAGEFAYLGMGGIATSEPVVGPGGRVDLFGIPDGDQDLIAYRSSESPFSARERAIIHRDQNIVNGGTFGTIDFNADESFAPATATVTVTGTASGVARHWMSYRAGPACVYYELYYDPSLSATLTVRGIPAAHQRPTDFHELAVYATDTPRYAVESFHALADRVIALPTALPAPTITALPGGHRRIQAALTLPPEYQSSLQVWWSFQRSWVLVTASFGWLGSTTATLTLPDFSEVTGWQQAFLPVSNGPGAWVVTASGANSAAHGGACAENARVVGAYATGIL
jgi:hypothetical protein